jgi:hypothetical protein
MVYGASQQAENFWAGGADELLRKSGNFAFKKTVQNLRLF